MRKCLKCQYRVQYGWFYCPSCGSQEFESDEEGSNCPVCGKYLLKQGLLNHIIGTAKNEFYKNPKSPHREYLDKKAL